MATSKCPRCEAVFRVGDGWAKAALSTLMPAPAVPDMATQVRCPRCGLLFADGDIRYLHANSSRSVLIVLAAVAALVAAWIAA